MGSPLRGPRAVVGALVLGLGAALAACAGSNAGTPSSGGGDATGGAGPGGGGSGGAGTTTITTDEDGGVEFDASSATDASTPTKFFLLIAATPAGSPDLSQWGGVLRYAFAADGAPEVMGTAIDKSLVHDPLGLAFRKTSAEVFVGNRHGNNAADGVPGSIGRFLYDATTESFTPSPLGDITGGGMGAISQVAFNPAEDELFAANCCNGGNGITRFKIDAKGNATPNGSINPAMNMQGVAVAPDGKRLYATAGGGPAPDVWEFELPLGGVVNKITVPGASRLHHITLAGSELFIGDVDTSVYHLHIEADDELTFVEAIPADNPLSVVFSPDGEEMFATAHAFEATAIVDRYTVANGAFTPTTKIVTPGSNGGTLAFSAAAVPVPPPK